MDNTALNFTTLTERINQLCYKLEYMSFLSKDAKEKLIAELKKLIEQRNKLNEMAK